MKKKINLIISTAALLPFLMNASEVLHVTPRGMDVAVASSVYMPDYIVAKPLQPQDLPVGSPDAIVMVTVQDAGKDAKSFSEVKITNYYKKYIFKFYSPYLKSIGITSEKLYELKPGKSVVIKVPANVPSWNTGKPEEFSYRSIIAMGRLVPV